MLQDFCAAPREQRVHQQENVKTNRPRPAAAVVVVLLLGQEERLRRAVHAAAVDSEAEQRYRDYR